MPTQADRPATEELWARLLKSPTAGEYLRANRERLPSLPDQLGRLCRARGMSAADVIRAAGLERSFGYHLFRGTRNPSRDTVLQLAFGLCLSAGEAQELLKIARMSPLHPKVPRDAVLAHCLERRAGFLGAQEELEERELPLLGGENG